MTDKLRSVRIADHAHLAQLVPALEDGLLSRSDTIALFMLMRGEARPGSAIKDIGHTVAHDSRDRGIAFQHMDRFADQFIAAATSGGIFEVRTLFPIDSVVEEIGEFLSTQQIPVDLSRVRANTTPLIAILADVLDDTEIKLRRDDVTTRLHGGQRPSFVLWPTRPIRGKMDLDPNVGIAGPMLRKE